MRTPAILMTLLAAGGACRTPSVDDGCRFPALDTAGWVVEDAGPFVLKRPPGLAEQTPGPAAGYVGLWSAEGRALAFDYGRAAADPRDRATGGEEDWLCETPVGGRPAIVRVGVRTVEARPGLWQRHSVAEAWWPAAGPDSSSLLIIGWGAEADSARVLREALGAARTVRFRTTWTSEDSLRQLHRFCTTLRRQAETRGEYRDAWEEWSPRCPSGTPPPTEYEQVH